MYARILGLGQWLPDRVRHNAEWPEEFVARSLARARLRSREGARHSGDDTDLTDIPAGGTDDPCDRIVSRHLAAEADDPFLGTTRRRVADEGVTTWQAESMAAEAALADAGIAAEDIDLVISWGLVPERVSQPSAPRVAFTIGAKNAFAFGVDAACASALAHLRCAAALIQAGQIRHALLTQSHLVTRTVSMGHPASPNVGDLATALIVGPSQEAGLVANVAFSNGAYYDAVTWIRRHQDTRWYQGGADFHMGSGDRDAARYLMQNAVRFGVDTVRSLQSEYAFDLGDLDALISVQPRRWIPGAIAEALGLPAEIAPQTFDELAHVGACGTVANLIAARERGMLRDGSMVAIYAQGAGFIRASALLRW